MWWAHSNGSHTHPDERLLTPSDLAGTVMAMTGGASQNILPLVERFRETLIAHATNGGADPAVFANGRAALIRDASLKPVLPAWIRTCRNLDDFWSMIKHKFRTYQERREWLRNEFGPIFAALEERNDRPGDASISTRLHDAGGAYVHEAWQKALARRDSDPDGAITMARTLLEEVCRYVLDEEHEVYDEKADLPKLYSIVAKKLKLAPSQHTEDIVKRILGGCHSIVEGLGALRSKVGDAHAKGKRGASASPRHAAFAVNVAGAASSFILETYEARKNAGALG